MPNLTLAIPKELQRKMRQHKEIRWSEVVRKSIAQRIEDLEFMEKLTKNSRLTQKDAEEVARKIDSRVTKKL